jgi:hypothetical protein
VGEEGGQQDEQHEDRRSPVGVMMGQHQQGELKQDNLALGLSGPAGAGPRIQGGEQRAADQGERPVRRPACFGQVEQKAAGQPGDANQMQAAQADVEPAQIGEKSLGRRLQLQTTCHGISFS